MRGALLLFASALALTLAMAAPVLEAPSERLFGREIVGRHHDAYTMVRQFERPARRPFSQPATDAAGALAARWLGGVRAYNLLVLATFPLAALFAFLLARYLGLPGWAAGIAGLAFAFSPAHVAHAAYHPHVAQVQWIPLYLLALLRCLERWSPGRAALLLAAGALLTLSNFYFGLFAGLLTPVVVVAWAWRRGGVAAAGWRPTALTLAGGGAVGWLYLRLTAGPLATLAKTYAFPAADLERYGARWYSYLLPPVDHPLAGDLLWDFWRGRQVADGLVEQQLGLGLALLALAAIGLALRGREGRGLAGHAAALLAALAVAGFLASLAPAAGAGGPWPAPAVPAMLHPLLPMFRAYARLGIVTQLAVAILAAAGAAGLAARGGRARWLAAALLLVGAVELAPFPPWRWHPVLPTEAHRWIARRPAPWKLLDCAAAPPAVARSIAQFLPQPVSLLSPRVPDCAEPGLPGKLAAAGFSHLLLRGGSAEERWHAGRDLPQGLEEQRRFADSRLLRVTAPPAPVTLERWQGFSWREYDGERTWRWLGPAGEWLLVNHRAVPFEARLELELWSLGEDRDLELLLDGRPLARLRVDTEPGRYVVGPLALAPGRGRLGWRPVGPAVEPHALLGNGDRRRLTVAVGAWRWLTPPGGSAGSGGSAANSGA